jgi:hypothetical protein
VLPEAARRLQGRGKLDQIFELQNHRTKPSQVVTPPRVLGATVRLLARRETDRRALLREVGALVAEDFKRRRLNRKPVYAGASPAVADAGPTEIEDNAAVTAAA